MNYISIGNDSIAIATCDIDRRSIFSVAKETVAVLSDQSHLVVVVIDGRKIEFCVGEEELRKRQLLTILGRHLKEK